MELGEILKLVRGPSGSRADARVGDQNLKVEVSGRADLRDLHAFDCGGLVLAVGWLGEGKRNVSKSGAILVDVEAELGKRITLMQNGLSSKLENRMWYFGETEAQAREALMKIDRESLQAIQQNMQIQNQYGQEMQNNKDTNTMQSTEKSVENKQEQKKQNTEMKNSNEQ